MVYPVGRGPRTRPNLKRVQALVELDLESLVESLVEESLLTALSLELFDSLALPSPELFESLALLSDDESESEDFFFPPSRKSVTYQPPPLR